MGLTISSQALQAEREMLETLGWQAPKENLDNPA